MLYAMFHYNWSTYSGEEDLLRVRVFTIYGHCTSWSCDLDYLYTQWFPIPIYLHLKFDFDWPNSFRGEDV